MFKFKYITVIFLLCFIVNIFEISAFADSIRDELDTKLQSAYVSKDAAGGLKIEAVVEGNQDILVGDSSLNVSSKKTRLTVIHDNRYKNGIKTQDSKYTRMKRSKNYVPFGYMLMRYERDYKGVGTNVTEGYVNYASNAKWEFYPGDSKQLLSELLFDEAKMKYKNIGDVFGQKAELSGMNNREVFLDIHFNSFCLENGRILLDRILRMRYKDAYYKLRYDLRYPQNKFSYKGEFVDNLTYIKLPKVGYGSNNDDRYEFLGWQIIDEGKSNITGPGFTEKDNGALNVHDSVNTLMLSNNVLLNIDTASLSQSKIVSDNFLDKEDFESVGHDLNNVEKNYECLDDKCNDTESYYNCDLDESDSISMISTKSVVLKIEESEENLSIATLSEIM